METPHDLDQRQMLRFQAGDESAFHDLFLRYKEPLFHLIFRYFNDRDLAEELTQDVFVRIYEAKQTYKPTHSLKSWFYSIATHLCLNTLRNRKKEFSLDAPVSEDSSVLDFEDRKNRGPQEEFMQCELGQAIAEALQSLTETQRMLILLVYFNETSITEAAEIIGTTPLGARLRLFRARERLKTLLSPVAFEQTLSPA